MSANGKILRKGFGLRKQVAPLLSRDFDSSLVQRARDSGSRLEWPTLTVRIAKEFGFCYGVDRAIDYAYETRARFPNKRIFLTGEVIHNPSVNRRLAEIGFLFLDGSQGSDARWEDVGPLDVLLIPAFGVSITLLERMRQTGALLVDTTCGSVLNVWKNVERFARDGFTCLIHGKWNHEETRATASRALVQPEGSYLVVRNMEQAERVCAVIGGREGPEKLRIDFESASSPGFDPVRDLVRIGMANQTTMLSSESLEIADCIRKALTLRYGEERILDHFRAFDTICSATEERQSAVVEMMKSPPQLMLIIGGYNSSNTGHLAEICTETVPTFHVKSVDEILSATEIRHQPAWTTELVTTKDWLPSGDLEIGITAGASTPDREVGAVIRKLLELRGLDPETIPPLKD